MPVNRRFSPRSSISLFHSQCYPDRVYVGRRFGRGAMACILAATYPDIFAAVAILAEAEFKAAISMSEGLAAMKRGGRIRSGKGSLRLKQCVPASAERISATAG